MLKYPLVLSIRDPHLVQEVPTSLSPQSAPRRTTTNQVLGPALKDFKEQITVLDRICNTTRQKDVE